MIPGQGVSIGKTITSDPYQNGRAGSTKIPSSPPALPRPTPSPGARYHRLTSPY